MPTTRYTFWHDRAVFHFLTEKADRETYIKTLHQALQPKAYVMIASFALDGPEKCSNLPVRRYAHESLSQELGEAFHLIKARQEQHTTPSGNQQSFQYSLFQYI
ncbi:hypothetical protein ACQZV8_17260 [Magnetococcales bacterium HHB-1]